mmetsp:Transcript_25166/g.49302  ORF Transcript_25166/g.49302 Transcript_25166/m.49302 type:complete len:209 (-) Transcript_25166:420-1046(-)
MVGEGVLKSCGEHYFKLPRSLQVFLSRGHWPTHGDERPFFHANQCVSLSSCCSWSYGLYSKTLRVPIENTVKLIEFWFEKPHQTPKLLAMIFKVVPLAVMSCIFAHIASHRTFSQKSCRASGALQLFLSVLAAWHSSPMAGGGWGTGIPVFSHCLDAELRAFPHRVWESCRLVGSLSQVAHSYCLALMVGEPVVFVSCSALTGMLPAF